MKLVKADTYFESCFINADEEVEPVNAQIFNCYCKVKKS